jgi:hypothetical protein
VRQNAKLFPDSPYGEKTSVEAKKLMKLIEMPIEDLLAYVVDADADSEDGKNGRLVIQFRLAAPAARAAEAAARAAKGSMWAAIISACVATAPTIYKALCAAISIVAR